ELIYLSGSTKASKKIQKIYDRAQELLLEGKGQSNDAEFWNPSPSIENKEMPSDCAFNTADEKTRKSSEESDESDSKTSQGGQKTLNFGFAISPETSQEITNSRNKNSGAIIPYSFTSGTLLPDSFTSDSLNLEKSQEEVGGI